MGRLLVLVLLVLGIGFILMQLLKFFVTINSSSAQRRRDIADMKSKMSRTIKTLVPMSHKELELLSVNRSNVEVSKGFNKMESGVFTSVYHEPLLAYAYKKYAYSTDHRLLMMHTSEDNYMYISEGRTTKVYLNDRELGVIDSEGGLTHPVSQKRLAEIEVDKVLSSHPVRIGGREVGEIMNVSLNESPNPRAYQFLEDMNEDEGHLFKALTFLSLIEESI